VYIYRASELMNHMYGSKYFKALKIKLVILIRNINLTTKKYFTITPHRHHKSNPDSAEKLLNPQRKR
jgi:hypothetical protein